MTPVHPAGRMPIKSPRKGSRALKQVKQASSEAIKIEIIMYCPYQSGYDI